MLSSKKKNNALENDTFTTAFTTENIFNELNLQIDLLIQAYVPELKNKKNEQGLLPVSGNDPESFIKTLSYLNNMLVRIQDFIAQQNLSNKPLKGKTQDPNLSDEIRSDFNALFHLKRETGIFHPIETEKDYFLAINLINILQVFHENDAALDAFKPFLNSSSFGNLFPICPAKINEIQSALKAQVNSSAFKEKTEKDLEDASKKISKIFSSYGKEVSVESTKYEIALERLNFNNKTREELESINISLGNPPVDLKVDLFNRLTELKSDFTNQKKIYLEEIAHDKTIFENKLLEVKSAYLELAKKKYQDFINSKSTNELILQESFDSINEPDRLYALATNETSLIKREESIHHAKNSWAPLIEHLQERLKQLNQAKEELAATINIDRFLTDWNENLKEDFKKKLTPIYDEKINLFTQAIHAVELKLQEATRKSAKLDELIVALNTLHLLDNIGKKTKQEIDHEIALFKQKISDKEKYLSKLEEDLQLLNSSEQTLESKISDLVENRIPTHKKLITSQDQKLKQLEIQIKAQQSKQAEENLAFGEQLTKATEEQSKIKKKFILSSKNKIKLKNLNAEIEGIEKMFAARNNTLDQLYLEQTSISKSYKRDQDELPSLEANLPNFQNSLRQIKKKKSELENTYKEVTLQLKNLENYLAKLDIVSAILEVNNKLQEAEELIKEKKSKSLELKEFLSLNTPSLINIIELYNFCSELEKENFSAISVLFEDISQKLSAFHKDEEFTQLVQQLVGSKEKKLNDLTNQLQQLIVELRSVANTAAANVSESIQAALKKLINLFTNKTKPFVQKLISIYQKPATYSWSTRETLRAAFLEVRTRISTNKKDVLAFQETLQQQLELTEKLLDKVHLKANLDLDAFSKSVHNLSQNHDTIETERDKSQKLAKDKIKIQERRNALIEQYSIILDEYLLYRNKKYGFKDFFNDKDKIKRQLFIQDLKIELWKYKNIASDGATLKEMLHKAILEYNYGTFSNKQNPTKNLLDIILSLNKDINEPLIDSLRISVPFEKLSKNSFQNCVLSDNYQKVLDNFLKANIRKYKVRYFFFDREKAKLKTFIDKLKNELQRYSEKELDQENFIETIKAGLNQFKTHHADKNNPLNNLSDILDLLLQDIVNPLKTHTSLRISGYLDREHAPILPDRRPLLATAPR